MAELSPIASKYFDPTTDFGFKKLFGEEVNKDLLKDFLNSMLPPTTFFHQGKTPIRNPV